MTIEARFRALRKERYFVRPVSPEPYLRLLLFCARWRQ